jgi:uncharacterized protein (TIGR00369 family)
MGVWADRINASIKGETPLPSVIERLGVGRIAEWRPGFVKKVWPLDAELLNPAGVLFGGYLGVLADQVLSFATMTVLKDHESLRTGDLSIDFFRPIEEGPLEIEGHVINRSRSQVHTEARFLLPGGKLAARGLATFAVLGGEPAS